MSISGIGSSTGSSIAQELLARMQGAQDTPEDFANSFVGDKDSDGDGQLTSKEAGINENKFNAADTNGDGYLTVEEISADVTSRNQKMGQLGQLSVQMQGSPQDLINSLMSESDEDGNGVLSQEESQLSDELFSALDTDGDGSISSTELDEALKPPEPEGAQAGTTVAASSTSEQAASSGSQSSSSSSDDEYDEYDLNQDGIVSTNELLQAYMNGDESLSSIVGQPSTEGGKNTTLMGIAMRAYQNQESVALYTQESAVA